MVSPGASINQARFAQGLPVGPPYNLYNPTQCPTINDGATSAVEIVTYPHPALRHKSSAIKRVDNELKQVIRTMFELMYEAKGIGLAANQVNLPLRLFVANLKSNPEEGEEVVFINPVISKPKGSEEAEEGCLSLPGLYGPVRRPKFVHVQAFSPEGQEINLDLDGLYSRVVQHETDHLDGVLFTDRMSNTNQLACEEALEEFSGEFRSRRETGGIPNDAEIATHLAEWESRYCS